MNEVAAAAPASRSTTIMLLVVVAAAILGWVTTLAGGFVYDDHRFVRWNPSLEEVAHSPWRAFDPATTSLDGAEPGMWRPLRTLSFAVDREVFGGDPAGFHLASILLHAVVAGLVFALGRGLGLGVAASGLGGLLFALHPVQAETVAWISSRGDLLCALFLLAATVVHLARGRLSLVVLLVSAAFLSKEAAVVAPLLLVVADAAAGGWARVRERRRVAAYVTGILLLWVLARSIVLSSAGATSGQGGGLGLGPVALAAAVPSMFTWYAGRILLPLPNQFDFQLEPGLLLASTAFGFLALLASWRRLPLARWSAAPVQAAAAWVVVALVPVTLMQVLFPLKILVADRFLYLAMAGPALAVAALMQRCGPRVLRAGLLVVPALLFATVPAAAAWRTDESLWLSVLERDPAHARAHHGVARAVEDRPEEALRHYRAYLERVPGDAGAWYRRGRMEETLAALEEEGPVRRGRIQQAALSYHTAVALWDEGEREGRARGHVDAGLRHARMLAALGDSDGARFFGAAAYLRWRRADPSLREASRAQVQSLRDWAQDIKDDEFREFLEGTREEFSVTGTGEVPR